MMINRLLLSTAEIVIIAAIMVVIAFLCYFALRDIIPKMIAKNKEKKIKQVEEKQAEEIKKEEEKQKEKELNEFDRILEKVHEERVPYFSEKEQVMEQVKEESVVAKAEEKSEFEIPDFDLPEFDREPLGRPAKFRPDFELNDSFDFDSEMFDDNFGEMNDDFVPAKLKPNFATASAVEPSFNSSDYVDEIRRKRKLRRNKTIRSEITSANDRIKAIMVLDIFKTKF